MICGLIGGLLFSFKTFALSDPLLMSLILVVLPGVGALEWWIQERTSYESTNIRRAVTGAMAGFSGGLALSFLLNSFT
jgi:hypothetical protein